MEIVFISSLISVAFESMDQVLEDWDCQAVVSLFQLILMMVSRLKKVSNLERKYAGFPTLVYDCILMLV